MARKRTHAIAEPAANGHDGGRLADDLLRGARAIADEIGDPLRRTRYLLERGHLPAKKVGNVWYGSKSRLREFFSARPLSETPPLRRGAARITSTTDASPDFSNQGVHRGSGSAITLL